MVRGVRAALAAVAVVLSAVPPGLRAAVRLEAVLAPAASVASGAGGDATFLLRDDGVVEWELGVESLSGPATSVTVRRGRVGDAGVVVTTLSNPPATGTHIGRWGPLDAATAGELSDEGLFVVVATAAHPDGELYGALRLVPRRDGLTCTCRGGPTAAFRRCVRRGLRAVPRTTRATSGVRHLVRVLPLAVCHAPLRPPRSGACCLPRTPAENLVLERLCAAVPAARCARLGGRHVPGAACGAAESVCP